MGSSILAICSQNFWLLLDCFRFQIATFFRGISKMIFRVNKREQTWWFVKHEYSRGTIITTVTIFAYCLLQPYHTNYLTCKLEEQWPAHYQKTMTIGDSILSRTFLLSICWTHCITAASNSMVSVVFSQNIYVAGRSSAAKSYLSGFPKCTQLWWLREHLTPST